MARVKPPEDQADAVLTSETGREWLVFCRLCPRTLGKGLTRQADARQYAIEHLEHSHGLFRVWVKRERVGYQAMVNEALPLVVAHDLTLATDRRTG